MATKKARREAEEEVALAAEQERGAIAEKSLQKEINGTSRPTSPKNSKPQVQLKENFTILKIPSLILDLQFSFDPHFKIYGESESER